jgi:large subunit ribosomal protein L25
MKKTEKIILKAEPRQIFGKKLNSLRKKGLIPANIYGQNFKSQAVTINFKDFIKVYKQAKETKVVYLELKEEKIPVLIKNIQRHPVNDLILHVDFRKIDLKQKIETEVPVVIIGESPAVVEKKGVLLTQLSTLMVSALPEEIPSEIKVDISNLKEIGQEIKVADLAKSSTYEIKTPFEKVIVSIIAHKEESVTPETTAPTVEVVKEEEKTTEETQAEVTPSAETPKK